MAFQTNDSFIFIVVQDQKSSGSVQDFGFCRCRQINYGYDLIVSKTPIMGLKIGKKIKLGYRYIKINRGIFQYEIYLK